MSLSQWIALLFIARTKLWISIPLPTHFGNYLLHLIWLPCSEEFRSNESFPHYHLSDIWKCKFNHFSTIYNMSMPPSSLKYRSLICPKKSLVSHWSCLITHFLPFLHWISCNLLMHSRLRHVFSLHSILYKFLKYIGSLHSGAVLLFSSSLVQIKLYLTYKAHIAVISIQKSFFSLSWEGE